MTNTVTNIARMTALSAVALGAMLAGPAAAQEWPERDMTFIVPYGPGGSTDPIGRTFSAELAEILDININVENRPGGSATIGTGTVIRAEPDGYTIGLGSNSSLMHQPLENSDLPWSSTEDFDTIVKLVDLPAVLYVADDAPWQDLEEFLAHVEENPGEVRVSVSGLRTAPDLVVQRFNELTGLEISTVPFSGGGGEALTAVLGGRVEASVGYGPSIKGYVESGDIRPIGVFQEDRYDLFPDAMTFPELGHDVTLPAAYYVIAPTGLPDDVRSRLVEASMEAIQTEDFTQFAETNGYNAEALGPDEADAELDEYGQTFAEILEFLGE